MVNSIIYGIKSETRRVLDPQPPTECKEWNIIVKTDLEVSWIAHGKRPNGDVYDLDFHIDCPYGYFGDRLWVQETLTKGFSFVDPNPCVAYYTEGPDGQCLVNRGSMPWTWSTRLVGPKDCPREAARIFLDVLSVKIERLHDINDIDIIREGVSNRQNYIEIWNSIYGQNAWFRNPWVWVVKFGLGDE